VARERYLAGAWVNPTNKRYKYINCLTQTNQSYATTFELQKPAFLQVANVVSL
jgi:hypothetical protein